MQTNNQQNYEKSNESSNFAQKHSFIGKNVCSSEQKESSESQEDTNLNSDQAFKYADRDPELDISQYNTDDTRSLSASEAKSTHELRNPGHLESKVKSESHDVRLQTTVSYTSGQVRSDYSEEFVAKSLSSEYATNEQSNPDYSIKPGTELTSSKQLEVYHSKQLNNETDKAFQSNVDENYAISKTESRHIHNASAIVPFSGQTRFLSGHSIAQPGGPTPTLNQLLQSSSPVHRFHSNYSSIGPETYQQPWPIQRSIVPSVYSQSNQRPLPTSSPRLHQGSSVSGSSSSSSYQSYNQRFSSPTRPYSPHMHHQSNTYVGQAGHSANLYAEQRSWSQNVPTSQAGQTSNQSSSSSQSPQRALSQSPAPPPAVSPQPQPSLQNQSFHGIQQRSTTPNTQGIDSGDLSGQNSNDSSNGPAGPATPNSQNMRPTPSPTGSTGSRSMSPAVGQQSVQMPPRPSSSQSDGGGPARMSLSPLAAQASSDESAYTPKVRKELMVYHSHPTTPQSTAPSPGAVSINSVQEDYPDINSPGWPRAPASPVYSSHVSQDPYRSKKMDGLAKLYEMDDSVERRTWLDKLLGFMEERRTPIASCPTISKNPLDLFRLYLYVKERGGFMEVCKVTKNKTWKDIAGLLGIGASSSAAYTLRKHYTKHLLAYECHFDRGGVDPQPIINQIEAGSKKKGSKITSSVPSPGSSNSQDSFSAGLPSSTSIDAYVNYPSSYSGSTISGPTNDYSPPPPRPPSQSSISSHSSVQQASYQNSASFQNYSQDQYTRSQNNIIAQQNDFPQTYSRTHFSPYIADIDRTYIGPSLASNNATGQEIYSRYSSTQLSGPYPGGVPVTRSTFSAAAQGHSGNMQQLSGSSQAASAQSQSTPNSTYSSAQDYYRQEQGNYTPTIGSHMYGSGGTSNKNMPPPSGPQQPRRHPDFTKEQYSSYCSQRASFAGWSTGSHQYSTGNATRLNYSVQSQSSSQHQQLAQTQAGNNSSISPSVNLNNSQQWSSLQNCRSSSQSNLSPLVNTSSSWDHRCNQTAPSYSSSAAPQSQLGINPIIIQHNSIPKRELTFPTDSVEAITPLFYKRRKLARADITPVEAWRIMMALRSGLLSESCWALDVLNILLFDDTAVQYFGLSHLPGLLDILLEHFFRSLSDMFDSRVISENHYFCKNYIHGSKTDLGAVMTPINPEKHTKLFTSMNLSHSSKHNKQIKIITKNDIFILDSRRSWDYEDIETDIEPWLLDTNAIKYIITCFESEMTMIPFVGELQIGRLRQAQKDFESNSSKNETILFSKKKSFEDCNVLPNCCKSNKKLHIELGQQEKTKKSKSLNDVLSRIKKESFEDNDFARARLEKKNCSSEEFNELEIESIKSLSEVFKGSNTLYQCNKSAFSNSSTPSTFISVIEENKVIDQHESYNEKREENDALLQKTKVTRNKDKSGFYKKHESRKIRDPSGILKRRRISDYEDESYSKDEASLYLVTEAQDNLARRCVCLSTVLRNLTFIPGNEFEFSKNTGFLSLLGKLLLLHHEHPIRTQKIRNYDREEDADFIDSCSSLQGETEWWWDFLYHIRENILVMAANISGHMDLSQFSEEISRPVLDGLLHWSVCPAAHGQDPFPTVNLSSSLSPKRLALEALCKLCVTESNVDLVVATPPFSRLQKLCLVLSRLLCRSEEQVLREFSVNLLYFLSAADSGIARTIALQTSCVALLVTFIEQAENSALGVVNQHGIAALRDNPESMGTSLDMLRRAAGTLLNLSRHPDNRALLLQHESRLLALVMSQILDQQVAAIIARVLFQCSRGSM